MAIIINNGQTPQEKTNINNQTEISKNSFYYENDFKKDINQIMTYSLDIALEKYFGNVLSFPLDRIIYASNEYCFRERSRKNGGELNLPFMNYYRINYSDTNREWFKNQSNLQYILGSEEIVKYLGSNFRVTPISCEYECTVFFSQHKDLEHAYKNLLFEKSNETIVPYFINIEDIQLNNTAILNMDVDFNQNYNENDWLEQNKIYTLSIDFTLQTFMIKGANKISAIANKVICDFISAKNGSDLKNLKEEDIISKIEFYFDGE